MLNVDDVRRRGLAMELYCVGWSTRAQVRELVVSTGCELQVASRESNHGTGFLESLIVNRTICVWS